MKILPTHIALNISSTEQGFNYLVGSLRESIRFWDYFVNWQKALKNANEISSLLKKWDSIIGSTNVTRDLRVLIESNPRIVMTIPALAVRDGSGTSVFQIADDPANPLSTVRVYDFSLPATTPELVDSAIHFLKMSGIAELLASRIQGSVNDYMLGVEAGLDSNGRKNRGGHAMEAAIKQHIDEICIQHGLRYMEQATDKRIKHEWDIEGTGDSDRIYDFVIEGRRGLIAIEVNFYSAGGSKLKSTAGEYKELATRLQKSGVEFVWITDGLGWKTAKVPLKSAFVEIDNVFNLELLAEGCLVDVVS